MEFKRRGFDIELSEEEQEKVAAATDLVNELYFSMEYDDKIEDEEGKNILDRTRVDSLRYFLSYLYNNELAIKEGNN